MQGVATSSNFGQNSGSGKCPHDLFLDFSGLLMFFLVCGISSPKPLRIRFWLQDVPGGTSSFRCRICLAGGSTQSAAWRLRNLAFALATNPPRRNVSGLGLTGDFPEKLLPNGLMWVLPTRAWFEQQAFSKSAIHYATSADLVGRRGFSKMPPPIQLWEYFRARSSGQEVLLQFTQTFDFTSPEWKLGCPPIIRVEEWIL